MKQYLHTIMRSLCIMMMLCGISNSAWAQSDWSEVFQLENPGDDENPAENGSDNPYIITDWDSFYTNANTISTEGIYFKLDESITSPIVMQNAPEYTLDITSDYLDMNSCTITVGGDGSSDVSPLSVDDFSSFTPIFSSDETLEGSVIYYFSVTASNWDTFTLNYSNFPENVHFVLGDDIALESAPMSSLNITSDYLIKNDHTITIGSDGSPIPVKDFSKFCPVFSTDLDAECVTYNLGVNNANWQSFTQNYSTLIERGNVKFELAENLYLKEAPATPLGVTSDNFSCGYSVTVGDDGSNIVSPWVVDFSSYEFSPVFSESDFENNVTYHFSITNANWNSFAENYSNFDINENVHFILGEDIYLADVPDSPLEVSPDNFNTNNYIIVGDYENPLEVDDFDNFPKVFSDSDTFGNYEKYYVKVTTDNMDAAVSYSSSASNIYKVLGDGVDLSSDDLKNTIEGGARFYINITDGNKEDVISLYNSLEVTDENFKPVLVLGEGVTISELGLDSGVNYYFSITKSNWDALVHEYNTLFPNNEWDGSTDKKGESNVYFVLDNYIDFDKLPIETLKIYPDNILFEFTGNDGNLTVGKTNPVSYQAPILPIMTYGHGDGDYYFKAEAETWDALAEYFSSHSNMFLVMTNNVILESAPTYQLSIGSENFISNGYKIIISDEFQVFSDESMDAAYVKYMGAETYEISDLNDWRNFLAKYNKGEVLENSRLKITNDIYLNSSNDTPKEPISLNTSFEDSYVIYVGTDSSSPITITSSFNRLFSDPSTDSHVNYYLAIKNQEGIERVASNLDDFRGINVLYIDQNEDGEDYDLSAYTFDSETQSLTVEYLSDDEITIILSNQSEGYPFPEEEGKIKYVKGAEPVTDTLAEELLNALLNGAVLDSDLQGPGYCSLDAKTLVGSGTQESPYQIYTYEMLEKLAEIVNNEAEDYTSGKYFKLGSDINMQGNERLTDLNGNASNTTPTLQFTKAFKGHFNGNKHSIGGMTCPLFANLNGATIEKLGIVDCKMAGYALAASATSSNITMSYVSGASLGLISEINNTVTDCYAYNTSTKATTTYNITAETTLDASGTHDILVGNCYTLSPISTASDIKTDCTLFIPTDNTIYKVDPSNDFFKRAEATSSETADYINCINWGSSNRWIENPAKSNVSLLHNVIYKHNWLNNATDVWGTIGGRGNLGYLYSWYIVDKKELTVPDADMRVKNIYYSRGTGAYNGLNTIYLPFAWNPSTDLYNSDGSLVGDDAKVYILADKLNDNKEFSDNVDSYTDYTQESTLLFFQPTNADFAKVSNALPAILDVPSSGWYIKRSSIANYYDFQSTDETASEEASIDGTDSSNLLPNLYNNYWSGDVTDDDLTGRSFMDITRLNTDAPGRAFHCGTFTEIEKRTFDSGKYNKYTCFKLNSAGTGMASVTSNSSVQPFRTFVAVAPGTSGAKASYKLGFCGISDIEDTPTEIDGVATEGIHLMTTDESKVYSIDGRYVGQYGNKKLAPGMYIMNGKKFVVK